MNKKIIFSKITAENKAEADCTISISLFNRKTAYSKRYVSTPFENRGNLSRAS